MNQRTIKKKVVGVDVGVDVTTYAIVDVKGEILASDSFPTKDFPNINGYVAELVNRILLLVEANGGYEYIRSVGVSASSANFLTGCIENSSKYPWKGVIPLAAMMRDRLGLAVAVGNNAHVTALGEYQFGCARGMRNFVVISLGTGMGSCIFSNGAPFLGFDGFAGEVGHTCIETGGRLCACGNRGCVEAYVAAEGIERTAAELGLHEPLETLIDMCLDGDETAREVFRRTGHWLAHGLANYASVLNPEAFIFTGKVMRAGQWLLNPAYEGFQEHVFHNIENGVDFMISDLDDMERTLLGASVLAWEVKEYSLFK